MGFRELAEKVDSKIRDFIYPYFKEWVGKYHIDHRVIGHVAFSLGLLIYSFFIDFPFIYLLVAVYVLVAIGSYVLSRKKYIELFDHTIEMAYEEIDRMREKLVDKPETVTQRIGVTMAWFISSSLASLFFVVFGTPSVGIAMFAIGCGMTSLTYFGNSTEMYLDALKELVGEESWERA